MANTLIESLRAVASLAERLENAELVGKLNKALLGASELVFTNIELREANQQLREQIKTLEGKLAFKGKLTRPPQKDFYFEVGDDGQPFGRGFCSRCWEVEHKAVHVHQAIGDKFSSCPECKVRYTYYMEYSPPVGRVDG